MVRHNIPPVYNERSEYLILGSFPSLKSREAAFFYAHPQNRFWRVLSAVFHEDTPVNTEDKRAFLLRNRIALWDVLSECEISGSADASIRFAQPNDISVILSAAPIKAIFVNGKTAEKYYNRFLAPAVGRSAVCLPSTSPANASKKTEELIKLWKEAFSAFDAPANDGV